MKETRIRVTILDRKWNPIIKRMGPELDPLRLPIGSVNELFKLGFNMYSHSEDGKDQMKIDKKFMDRTTSRLKSIKKDVGEQELKDAEALRIKNEEEEAEKLKKEKEAEALRIKNEEEEVEKLRIKKEKEDEALRIKNKEEAEALRIKNAEGAPKNTKTNKNQGQK